MGSLRMITTYALILLNILGALYAETHLKTFAGPEIFVIAAGMVCSFILMIALAVETRWSWSMGIINFSLALANNIFLFALTRHPLAFLSTIFLNLLGFIISAVSLVDTDTEENDDENTHSLPPIETYAEEQEQSQPAQTVETYDVPKQKKKVK